MLDPNHQIACNKQLGYIYLKRQHEILKDLKDKRNGIIEKFDDTEGMSQSNTAGRRLKELKSKDRHKSRITKKIEIQEKINRDLSSEHKKVLKTIETLENDHFLKNCVTHTSTPLVKVSNSKCEYDDCSYGKDVAVYKCQKCADTREEKQICLCRQHMVVRQSVHYSLIRQREKELQKSCSGCGKDTVVEKDSK